MNGNSEGRKNFALLKSRGLEITQTDLVKGHRIYRTHSGMKNIRVVWMKTTDGGTRILEAGKDYKVVYCSKCGYPFATVLTFFPLETIKGGIGASFYSGRLNASLYSRSLSSLYRGHAAAKIGIGKIDIQQGVWSYRLPRRMKEVGPIWIVGGWGKRRRIEEGKDYTVVACSHCQLPHAIDLARKPARSVQDGLWVAFSTQPGRCGTCGGMILGL